MFSYSKDITGLHNTYWATDMNKEISKDLRIKHNIKK